MRLSSFRRNLKAQRVRDKGFVGPAPLGKLAVDHDAVSVLVANIGAHGV